MNRNEEQLPDDLLEVAEHLRTRRHAAGPMELDQLKRRATMQAARASRSRQGKGLILRSRIITVALVFGLALSGGAAGVIAGKTTSSSQPTSAARSEYKCNSGNGNGPEAGGPSGVSPDCDPGNSGNVNEDNDREGPGGGQTPPPPRNKK